MRFTMLATYALLLCFTPCVNAQWASLQDTSLFAPPAPVTVNDTEEVTLNGLLSEQQSLDISTMQHAAAPETASADQGDNGTNPAQNARTFVFTNEYYTLRGGNRINTNYARFKFPWFEKRGALLLEVPLVYYDFKSSFPGLPQIGGLGDIKIQGSYNAWTSQNKKYTVLTLLEAFLPTADNALVARSGTGNELTAFNLGTGKYVLGPGVGIVYARAPNFIIAPLYFFEASAFGNEDRPEIRRGKFRLFAMYAWESGAYVLPEFQAVTNYIDGNNDFYVAPEMGYSHKGTTAYLKPGIGIAPDLKDREWGLEFGFRVLF